VLDGSDCRALERDFRACELGSRYVTYGEQLIHQGKKEGRHERGHELLCKLLARRFGPLPASCLARLDSATEADIDRWAERILDAKTLDEVFEAQGAGTRRE
jgi:hypothetical protein